MSVVETSG